MKAAQIQNAGKDLGGGNANGFGGGASSTPSLTTAITTTEPPTTASPMKQSSGTTVKSSPVADDGKAVRTGPYVDKASSKNVTALLGKTAYLNCRVKNLGNKTVSLFHLSSHMLTRSLHLSTGTRH